MLVSQSLKIEKVNFNGVELIGIQTQDGKVLTGVKKICDDLGLDLSAQLKRIKRDEILKEGVVIIAIPSESGLQDTSCIDIEFLPTFLAGIQSSRCKIEVQPILKDFKLKAKEVLAAAFIKKENEVVKPKSNLQMIAEMALEMDRIEQHQKQFDNRLSLLESTKEKNLQEFRNVEAPKVLPLERTRRMELNLLVRNYCELNQVAFQDTWNEIYREFGMRSHMDVKQRAENKKIKPLDYLESIGKIEEIYSVAYEMLKGKF